MVKVGSYSAQTREIIMINFGPPRKAGPSVPDNGDFQPLENLPPLKPLSIINTIRPSSPRRTRLCLETMERQVA